MVYDVLIGAGVKQCNLPVVCPGTWCSVSTGAQVWQARVEDKMFYLLLNFLAMSLF